MKRIIRVFPRRTSATPDDELVRIGDTPSMFDEADEVHISAAFTWDIPQVQRPSSEYFAELFRVSRNQIIWGGNYYDPTTYPRGYLLG